MEINARILLVEDDKNLGYILSEYLTMKGFTVSWAKDGIEALAEINKNPYSLCILDVMLPSLDGFTVAEKLSAAHSPVPYIFLTARNLKIDKLKGFKLGCDDYIVKPVDEEELVARINAVLKRTAISAFIHTNQPLPLGSSTFDFHTQVLHIAGVDYKLTSKESEVLLLLIHHKNTLLNRDMALKKVWGSNDYLTAAAWM